MQKISAKAKELALRHEHELRQARTNFLSFCLYVTPTFDTNWHVFKLCDAVDDLVFGRLDRLFVAMPPQIGKSTIMSVHYPAFLLGVKPDCRLMTASYGIKLAAHFNKEVQALITSERYKQVFPGTKLRSVGAVSEEMSERTQSVFRIVGRRGGLRSLGTQTAATGFSADDAIIDDAHKDAKEAASKVKRDNVFGFFRNTLTPRLQQGGTLAVIGTRWNEKDIGSHMIELSQQKGTRYRWRTIIYPAIKETPPNQDDPREIGEALWPARFTIEELLERRKTLGDRDFNALYQQRPAPAEGTIVKVSWFQRYTVASRPAQFDSQVISADLTYEDTGDYCAFSVWGTAGADRYLLHMVRERMTFTEQLHRFVRLCKQYPKAEAKLVEKAANGAALINTLRRHMTGIVPVSPRDSKQSRLASVAPVIEAGNVFLPVSQDADWVEAYLEEFRSFPNGMHDDMVDSTSMALAYIQENTLSFSFSPQSLSRESPFSLNLGL